MSTVTIKREDTMREITDTLLVDNVPIDLTTASVVLVLRYVDGTVVRRAATIESPEDGDVSYQLVADDVDEIGEISFEWEVTDAGLVITVPTSTYHTLRILNDLG